jgi:predicted deacylase
MHRRTFGFLETGVWISNEFPGGRASDAWREDDTYVVQLEPENAPVNNSAWYAFKIWSRAPDTVPVRLTYEGGDHRYWPKVRGVDGTWVRMDSSAVSLDRERNEASLRLAIGPDTLWVAGQEMMTSASFEAWTDSLARQDHVTGEVIGRSGRGRPILMAEFGNEDASRHVMVIGRQHPPEATGTMALLAFVEELAGDAPLAREFRSEFRVHVVPLVNPDGVDLGHWRHNTGGVDLNRDWEAFNQPETRVVRDAFSAILAQPGHELWFGVDFHSTQYDVFYTLDRELATDPPDILDPWLDYIGTHLPDYEVNDSPSGLDTPMSRNWFYRAFGAPALIYEVGDQTDRALIREVAETAARGTMAVLLEALHRRMPPDAGLPG